MNNFIAISKRPALVLFLAACLLLVQTHASMAQFETLTIEREKQIGEQFLLELQQESTLIDDPFITSYVNHVGQKLVAQMKPPPFKYKFFVLKDPTFNSFAVPGGYVFLNTGMILEADRVEEMAGVMAHEVSHIYCRHMAQMVEKSKLVTVASIVGAIASVLVGGAMAAPLIMGTMGGGETAMLSYSREFEGQADAMGFKWMLKAGYNPRGMLTMFQKMSKQRWFEGGGKTPLYLQTHPYTDDRIVVLAQKLQIHQKELPPYRNDPDFHYFTIKLDSICGNIHQLLRSMTQSAIREPQNPVFPYGQALAYSKLEQHDKALAAFQQALKLDPDNHLIQRELAIFYFDHNQYPEATQLLTSLANRAPQDDVALYYLGRIYQERKQIDQALSMYEKVSQLNPTFGEVYYYLGTLYGEKGKLGLAHYYLALHSLRAGSLSTAMFHFRTALKNLSPADPRYAEARQQLTRLQEMKVKVRN
jgi:predicted Zn-dependent protease